MALSKAHRFPPLDYYLSLLCKAFGHPARIEIFRYLYKHQDELVPVYVLAERIPLADCTLSEHLNKLRKLGIVTYLEIYPYMFYGLNEESRTTCEVLYRILNVIDKAQMGAYTREVPLVAPA